MAGIVYVIFNKWVNDPETQKMPYKIGITSGTVEDRYYGLGLKMPGEFETHFAYLLENYKQAETFFHNLFKIYRNNGEWFNLEQKQLDLFKLNCEEMGGIDVKDKIEIKKDPIKKTRIDNGITGGGKVSGHGIEIFDDISGYSNTVQAVLEGVKQSKKIKIEGSDTPVELTDFGILDYKRFPLPYHKVVYFHILNGNPKHKYWVTVITKRGKYFAKCSFNIDEIVSEKFEEPIENLEFSVIVDRIKEVIFEAIKATIQP